MTHRCGDHSSVVCPVLFFESFVDEFGLSVLFFITIAAISAYANFTVVFLFIPKNPVN